MGAAERLVIVDGYRTPFCKAGTLLKDATAGDLATHVFREVLDRTGIDPEQIDEVILGCAGPGPNEANVARVASLRAGVPEKVPAVTVMRNCASGMESLHAARMRMLAGAGEIFLIGGAESMSKYPLLMGDKLVDFFMRLQKARTGMAKLKTIASFRPSFLAPRVAILEGLTDPVTGMMMGSTADLLAREFGVSREQQDEFALESHAKASSAMEHGSFDSQITPLTSAPMHKEMVDSDNGVRPDQSLSSLAKLRPVFDKREGDVTVGNACQVSDGATAMLVMSESRAQQLDLQPLAIVRGHGHAGLDPRVMGLGPVHATPIALRDAGLDFDDIDLFEINEAFAAQVLACQKAFASEDYCREHLGLSDPIGEIAPEKLNVNGGAIALGHPIAATGARIVLALAHELRARNKRHGLATLCIGGGQGQAVALEVA